MDYFDTIVDEIYRLSKIAGDARAIDGYENISADYYISRLHDVSVDDDELKKFVDLIRNLAWLQGYDGGIVNASPISRSSISLGTFARWLIAQGRARPARDCLVLLRQILEVNKAALLEIVPVWGFSPKSSIELGDGLKIVPIEELPPSKLRDLFMGTRRHRFSFDIVNSSPRPGSALIKETVDGPIYELASSSSAAKMRNSAERLVRLLLATSQAEREKLSQEVQDDMDPRKATRHEASILKVSNEILRVIALVCPLPVFGLGQWYQRPEYLPIVGVGGNDGGLRNEHPFFMSIQKQEYAFEEIQELVGKYFRLSESTRNRLKTPLARLNEGRRQLFVRNVEAAAIDLGIAAEALLTRDRDNDAPISFLLRTRGALLLGGSSEDRRRNYFTLRDLYGLRSIAAHQGKIVDYVIVSRSDSEQQRFDKALKTLSAGEAVCRLMIRRIIDDGGFPAWDDLVLGV